MEKKHLFFVSFLSVGLLASALAVVYSVHAGRQKTHQLNALLKDKAQIQVEYGQLLLEQSSVGNYGLVEKKARQKLAMKVPASREIVIVRN